MMMLIRFLCLALIFFSFPAWSLYFNWSGWTRFESYYQHSEEEDYYGGYHLVLSPEIHVMDGLTLKSRLDLKFFGDSSEARPLPFRQRGLILASSGKPQEWSWDKLFLNPSQIYVDYETELLTVRLGRAPYHFGLGTVYSASENPFHHWMSVYNQASVYLEYSQFYLQPVFLNEQNRNRFLIQAGWLHEDWGLEAFYQHDFEEDSLIQIYGKYEQPKWELKSSFSYLIKEKTNGALAVEASADLPESLPFKLELKAGGAVGEFVFHPNYDVSLLFWNRLISKGADSESALQIAEGQIQKGLYFSPRLLFSFFDDNFKIRPITLLAHSFEKKAFHYELDLEAMYRLGENLFFSVIGGALYSHKKSHFALLAQAAVSF